MRICPKCPKSFYHLAPPDHKIASLHEIALYENWKSLEEFDKAAVALRLDASKYERFLVLAKQDNRPIFNFIETTALGFLENERMVDELEMEEIRNNDFLMGSVKVG